VDDALAGFEGRLDDGWHRLREGDRATWTEGARAQRTAEALRWGDRDWRPARIAAPAWPALVAEGARGRLVRRLRLDGEGLAVEVG
jgi:hypothetical protein